MGAALGCCRCRCSGEVGRAGLRAPGGSPSHRCPTCAPPLTPAAPSALLPRSPDATLDSLRACFSGVRAAHTAALASRKPSAAALKEAVQRGAAAKLYWGHCEAAWAVVAVEPAWDKLRGGEPL